MATDIIVVPQPRQRDTILSKARSSYETVAQKAGETAAYPGNWLYETWSGKLNKLSLPLLFSLTLRRV